MTEKLLTVDVPEGMFSFPDETRIGPGGSPIVSGFTFSEASWKRRPGIVRALYSSSNPHGLMLVDWESPGARPDPLYTNRLPGRAFLFTLTCTPVVVSMGATVTFTISEVANQDWIGYDPGRYLSKDVVSEAVFWIEARSISATTSQLWTKAIGPVRWQTDAPHRWISSVSGTLEFRIWISRYWPACQTVSEAPDVMSELKSRWLSDADTTYFYATEKATRIDNYFMKWLNATTATYLTRAAETIYVSPGTSISDNFDRADGPLGSAWEVLSQVATTSATRVVSQVATKTWDILEYTCAAYKTPFTTADHYLQASVKLNSATYDVRNFIRIALRGSNYTSAAAANDGYMINCAVAATGTPGYPRGIQIVHGSTILWENYTTYGISNDKFYTIKAQVKTVAGNPVISVWLDGVLLVEYTDTSASKVLTGLYSSFLMYRGYLDSYVGADV